MTYNKHYEKSLQEVVFGTQPAKYLLPLNRVSEFFICQGA
jgi:hypothetical protein